jgi:hypothetical protein
MSQLYYDLNILLKYFLEDVFVEDLFFEKEEKLLKVFESFNLHRYGLLELLELLIILK